MPKNKKTTILEPEVGQSAAQQDGSSINASPMADEIARRAYEIYLERGSGPGRDLDDWLRAEQELKAKAP